MPKQATSLPLSLAAPLAGTPLYRWFYDELRSAILEGRIVPGARLPATRDLAREYKLSRATVVVAFEQLMLRKSPTPDTRPVADRPGFAYSPRIHRSIASGQTGASIPAGTSPWRCPA